MKKTLVVLMSAALLFGGPAMSAGGKNAYNNPSGSPSDDDFEMPYLNVGEGRVLVQCAEDEEMLITPLSEGGVEIVCAPAEEQE